MEQHGTYLELLAEIDDWAYYWEETRLVNYLLGEDEAAKEFQGVKKNGNISKSNLQKDYSKEKK